MNKSRPPTVRRIRVKFITADKDYLYMLPAASPMKKIMKVKYHLRGLNEEFDETVGRLWRDAQLNLLNVAVNAEEEYLPAFIVLEPDYLLDISSLAECFKEYGSHPVNYLLNRLDPIDNTRPLLLPRSEPFGGMCRRPPRSRGPRRPCCRSVWCGADRRAPRPPARR